VTAPGARTISNPLSRARTNPRLLTAARAEQYFHDTLPALYERWPRPYPELWTGFGLLVLFNIFFNYFRVVFVPPGYVCVCAHRPTRQQHPLRAPRNVSGEAAHPWNR
jgi:hypothetical protein